MKPLTPMERSIATLVAKGNTYQDIADLLCMSPRTIEGHLRLVRAKVGARGIADLTRYVLAQGWLEQGGK